MSPDLTYFLILAFRMAIAALILGICGFFFITPIVGLISFVYWAMKEPDAAIRRLQDLLGSAALQPLFQGG